MTTSALPATSNVNSQASQGTGSTSSSSGGLGAMTSADFLKLFISQLQNQDPLNPTSSDQFLTQTAQFSQVQGITQLNQSITQLLSGQQLTQGADLIGKQVTYQLTGADAAKSGVVSAVSMVNGQAQLTIGSDSVPLAQVQNIKAA